MVQDNNVKKELKRQTMNKGMAIGLVMFIPFGIILSILVGNPAFIGMGVPIGLAVGIGFGESLYERKVKEYDNESD